MRPREKAFYTNINPSIFEFLFDKPGKLIFSLESKQGQGPGQTSTAERRFYLKDDKVISAKARWQEQGVKTKEQNKDLKSIRDREQKIKKIVTDALNLLKD